MTYHLKNLQNAIGIQFKNLDLLKEALTHRSYLNEHPHENLQSNERLEFLGDAILEFIVSEFLFRKFPHLPEGKLTHLRSKLVRTESLSEIADQLKMGDFLFMSKGEQKAKGASNQTTLANTFEAVIGAIYQDQGLTPVILFIQRHLLKNSRKILSSQILFDFKSKFQEAAQEKFKFTPQYRVVKSFGPDHGKTFLVQVLVHKTEWGIGQGKSKQEAEQAAAHKALLKLTSKRDGPKTLQLAKKVQSC